jgi:L-methionine (R)-S-oxide reductase
MSFEPVDTLDMSTPDAKRASYELLVAQVRSVLEGERDWLANLAQFSALVYQSVPALNWAGFYMAHGQELVVGPFQGKIACVRIPFTRGVCGACASTREIQRVEDVHAFPGHIACDSASNSELVLPVLAGDQPDDRPLRRRGRARLCRSRGRTGRRHRLALRVFAHRRICGAAVDPETGPRRRCRGLQHCKNRTSLHGFMGFVLRLSKDRHGLAIVCLSWLHDFHAGCSVVTDRAP